MNLRLLVFALLLGISAVHLALAGQRFRRVDAGGHELRMLISGQGGPTVIFESGSGSPLETWVRVQPEISKFARAVAYDRAGNGLSEKGPTPRDGRQVAKELHTVLGNAHLPPPYILVGHSLGGPFIRIFAGMFPTEVAGLVLVDPTQEELIAWAKARENKPASTREPRLTDEVDCAPRTFAEAKETPVPSGIPVTLISGLGPRKPPSFLTARQLKEVTEDQKTYWPAKSRFHREWVEQFPRGRFIITEKSGHGIPFEEPDLIVQAIREMVVQSKISGP